MTEMADRPDVLVRLIADILRDRSLNICTAESLTGGMVAVEITAVEGASEFYCGSVVAYQSQMKTSVLGIDAELLAAEGTVSEACATAMVLAGLRLLGADTCVATTGVAGPASLEGKLPGSAWVAVGNRDAVEARYVSLPGVSRDEVRLRTVVEALSLTYDFLKNGDIPTR